jgi:4-carboxymuconolactone decarboxylase
MSSSQTTDRPVLNLLASMTADAIEATTLDPKSMKLTRIAALVAVDAPPASYLMNLGAAGEVDVTAEEVQGVLAAVAPIVGTARVVAATGNIMRALAIELGDLEAEATPTR